MAGWLLDTDSCIFWLKDQGVIRGRVDEKGGLKRMSVSSISAGELWDGVQRARSIQDDTPLVASFLKTVEVVPYNEETAYRFGILRGWRRAAAEHNFDLMNAAIALTRGMIVVTNNIRHYQAIPGLKVQNWVADPNAREWLRTR